MAPAGTTHKDVWNFLNKGLMTINANLKRGQCRYPFSKHSPVKFWIKGHESRKLIFDKEINAILEGFGLDRLHHMGQLHDTTGTMTNCILTLMRTFQGEKLTRHMH
ncbi:hypothetical protein CR513_49232, partial [Mucuna pruriens]